MKKIAVIQARMGSSRLPGKVMREINGKPLMWHMINRSSMSDVDEIYLATSNDPKNDVLCDYVATLGVKSFRNGIEDDLLGRFYDLVKEVKPDVITRIYADCPCIDPALINLTLYNLDRRYSYTAGYPRGCNAYSFKPEVVEYAYHYYKDPVSREFFHTFASEGATVCNSERDMHGFSFCVDTASDLEYIQSAYKDLGNVFGYRDLVNWAMQQAVGGQKIEGRVRNI